MHPEDERYRHLVGRETCLPLTGRLIPVIADDHVDPAFGSGCVKITPARFAEQHCQRAGDAARSTTATEIR